MQERELDNPIYGADDSAAQEAEPEDLYTIPDSPPCNVYDRVAADDHPFRGARMGNVNMNDNDGDHTYSTVAT